MVKLNSRIVRSSLLLLVLVIGLLVPLGAAMAAANPSGTGQPNQTCQLIGVSPGNAATAPGSAFNTTSGKAGTVYAGTQPQNSNNPMAVSQYDVGCFQVSQH